ncbi:ATP-binding cassette domain-containing protein [Robiginitalea sp. SC105]|uniref:ATP-binding cassette domain-containing protein n=1 Tax=Robiginitalea sp. SC105 TaxID=2762332 RepID=UPI0016396C74|nr:ATP-binding cassette domain-containing protein [Robiginitalea sp. SC105]MBC2839757.1 ATP-binding cassette domain-containing protein [Robiginitalea sp. SC105]
MHHHTAIFTDNSSRKTAFSNAVLAGNPPAALSHLGGLRGACFSNERIAAFIEEEARHNRSELQPLPERELRTFSSGERKKALLEYLLEQSPEYLILDDPFDNLDRAYRGVLERRFAELSREMTLIQLVSRRADILPCMKKTAFLRGSTLVGYPDFKPESSPPGPFSEEIPPPPNTLPDLPEVLVDFRAVSVSYGSHAVVRNIDWRIRQGEFWELRGPNGSGKTTLITLITGDNPKAYGQELYLFGSRKGSGESVWDIKEHIGYFTPAMADRFRGYHSLENMVISGLTDSIGLYQQPSDLQRSLANQWLRLLGMDSQRQVLFRDLTAGEQRLVFCARAMIKHPPLLILDEPTAGLDEKAASLVVSLIRKMALESRTAIVFVSHRSEPGLDANRTLILEKHPGGSTGYTA